MQNTSGEIFDRLNLAYSRKRDLIKSRIGEFRRIIEVADDTEIFEELCYCIFTAGASARMGHKSVAVVRDVLPSADLALLSSRLQRVHRFPNSRSSYIIHTRDYLARRFNFKLRDLIVSLDDPLARRDFFARDKNIKGIGYKEASHFLRNIGFPGYAILDKHIIRTLFEYGLVESLKPPQTRDGYLRAEEKLKSLSLRLGIDFDELDLLLWSEKTGEILK